jgi:rhodanese-related sulfurtransferase
MKPHTSLLLVVLTLATLSLMAEEQSAAGSPNTNRLSVEQFDSLRLGGTKLVLLDVRTKAEFDKGHIPGATNLNISSEHFESALASLDRGTTYLVNCESGGRSTRACRKMTVLGFTNLFELKSGFAGWKKSGKPVEK